MAALFSVLSLVGKILLGLLLILVIGLLLILFFPIRYQATIVKTEEDFSLRASASWLFRVVFASAALENGSSAQTSIRLFGIPLLPLIQKHRQRREKRKEERAAKTGRIRRERASVRPSVAPGNPKGASRVRLQKVEVIHRRRTTIWERMAARLQALMGKARMFFRKLRTFLRRAEDWITYLQSDAFAVARAALGKEGKKIVRHLLPRKAMGWIRFGLEDPARTGQVLGLLAALTPYLPKKIEWIPDFCNTTLDADLQIRGHLLLVVPVFHAGKLVLKKEVRSLIGRFRNHQNRKKDKARSESWQTTKNAMSFRAM